MQLPPGTLTRGQWAALALRDDVEPQEPAELPGVEVHHSVGLYNTDRLDRFMQALEADHRSRDWPGPWYALVIWIDGTPAEARGVHWRSPPAHHLTVCVAGNYDEHEPTDDQLDTLQAIRLELAIAGGGLERAMHRDRDATSCPGHHLAARVEDLPDPLEDAMSKAHLDRIEAKVDRVLERIGDRDLADDHKRIRDSIAALGHADGLEVDPTAGTPRRDVTA